MRYNKKGSSYWGLKPPVVRSVHFSTRGGTHCPLCAHWMAHMKNTHPCRDTHWNTHTFQHKHAAGLGLEDSLWHQQLQKRQNGLIYSRIHKQKVSITAGSLAVCSGLRHSQLLMLFFRTYCKKTPGALETLGLAMKGGLSRCSLTLTNNKHTHMVVECCTVYL